MASGRIFSKEPEAILGDLDLGLESSYDSDHATTRIKYEDVNIGNEAQNDFNTPIVSKIEFSDIGVDFEGSQNDLIDTSQVKFEKEVEEPQGHGQSTGNRAEDLFCEACNMRFANKYGLKRHLNSHRRMPCQVKGCSIVSYTKDTFYNHQKTHEIQNVGAGAVLYSCTFPGCSRLYKTVDSLKNHRKKLKHSQDPENMKKPPQVKQSDPPFICNKCGENYESKYRLTIHIKNVCLYSCPFEGCSKISKTKAHLDSHLRSHTGDCKCEFCGSGFKRKNGLDKHRVLVHLEELPEKDREENEKKFAKLKEEIRKYKKRYKAKKLEKTDLGDGIRKKKSERSKAKKK